MSEPVRLTPTKIEQPVMAEPVISNPQPYKSGSPLPVKVVEISKEAQAPQANVSQAPQAAIAQPYILSIPGTFGELPISCTCPTCHEPITTQVHHENGTLTWLLCVILCIFTLICFFIPFLINSLKDIVHTCPNCHNVVGKRQRM